jgi:predicted nucleic acid-binding Zn ribbon protein
MSGQPRFSSHYRRSPRRERTPETESTPTGIRAILSSVLSQNDLDHKLAKYEFVTRWHEVVGGPLAAKSRPELVNGSVLVIRVIDSVWAQELSFSKHIIINRVKKIAPHLGTVDDIKFRIGPL